jgi:hypothetical protein
VDLARVLALKEEGFSLLVDESEDLYVTINKRNEG